MSILGAATMFFLVMDPFGNIPLFLTALRTTPPERRQWVILRECLIALVVMVTFLFAGAYLLKLLAIEEPALEAAGGVILLLIAIRMVFPTPEKNLQEATLGEPLIVPLAVPYIAGPSLLAIEVVLVTRNPDAWLNLLAALLITWALTTLILYASGFLHRVLGERVLVAVERLMGMILVLISIQMMLNGTRTFFHLG